MRIKTSGLSLRSLGRRVPHSSMGAATTSIRHAGTNTPGWKGRQSEEHITNRKDALNVQASASQSGKKDRISGESGASQATTEADHGNQNEQAKKDHPEAPDIVIGMNDERGGVSGFSLLDRFWHVRVRGIC